MKILSIGNSFSRDAQRYVHEIAKKEGVDLTTFNLYIGGCSLETHYQNMISGTNAYELDVNGVETGMRVSLDQGLEMPDIDYVTLQQASHLSFDKDSYSPYLEELAKYVKERLPNAKILIHQTWPYEDGGEVLKLRTNYSSSKEMLEDVRKAYENAVKLIKADGMILSGSALYNAVTLGLKKAYRDTFHASYGAGRYLLGLTWFKTLTKKDISNDTFLDLDEPITRLDREIILNAVNNTIK